MCGILGGFGIDVAPEALQASLLCLSHRGPDGEGMWQSQVHRAWLGHRRLSIVDLSDAGIQPMQNEDGNLHLVCNGEIYNSPTLRRQLESHGHRFASHSDSEVILHAYEQWGEGLLDRIEGMFAFALWDDCEAQLLCARDRIGMKPLFFTEHEGGLFISSTLAPLLALLPAKPKFDPLAMSYAMTLGYVPAPYTVWQGIEKLRPAHLLTWSTAAGVATRVYWEPPRHTAPDAGAPLEQWEELFPEILEEHLLSDVPIALFLSAGLDSSAMAMGLRNLGQPVQAVTLGFPDSDEDESQSAAAMARALGFPHQVLATETDALPRLLDQATRAIEEPQSHTSLLNIWAITNAVSGKYKVALSGNGGDEVFGGYRWYRDLDAPLDRTAGARRSIIKALGGALPYSFAHRQAASAFKNLSVLHRHAWRHFARFLPEEAEALFGSSFTDDEMLGPMGEQFVDTLPLLRALQRVDLLNFCTYTDLAKMDFAGMAHAVEVRTPFLDRRIVEWGLQQPVNPATSPRPKQLLRDYLQRHGAPEEILNHPKRGFSFKALEQFDTRAAVDEIRRGYWVREGIWPRYWERIATANVPQRLARIWVLLNLTRWANVWLGNNNAAQRQTD